MCDCLCTTASKRLLYRLYLLDPYRTASKIDKELKCDEVKYLILVDQKNSDSI